MCNFSFYFAYEIFHHAIFNGILTPGMATNTHLVSCGHFQVRRSADKTEAEMQIRNWTDSSWQIVHTQYT